MNALAVRREARRRVRSAHIATLEKSLGISPGSTDPRGLPRIVVVRNPAGEWFMGDRWITRGFDYGHFTIDEVRGATKRACIRKARGRLRAMVERDLTGEIEVTL